MSAKAEETLDMQRHIKVQLLDDDSNIIEELKKRFPSVEFETLTINDMVAIIGIKSHQFFVGTDLIFIDTFYKDDKSDYYAINFFDEYRKIDSETMRQTEGKYSVLVGIDDVNERLQREGKVWMQHADEKTELMALMGKVRKHPYLEWGGNKKTSKIDKIAETVEQYAQKNRIYLYRKSEMSFDEWIDYMKSLINKTEILIDDIIKSQSPNSEIPNIINSLRGIIAEARKQLNPDGLEDNNGTIRTMVNVLDFAQEYIENVGEQIDRLDLVGIQDKNGEIKKLAHHFNALLTHTDMNIFGQKRRMKKMASGPDR